MSRTRSIRPHSDPEKPANVARRDGRRAREAGRPRNSCPYDVADTYGRYLTTYWLEGWDEPDRETAP